MLGDMSPHLSSPVVHVIGSLMIDRVVRVRRLPVAGETVAAVVVI